VLVISNPTATTYAAGSLQCTINNFESISVSGTAGVADLHGSAGTDTFTAKGKTATLQTANLGIRVEGTKEVIVTGEGGDDVEHIEAYDYHLTQFGNWI
jgi:hypothetical protein